MSHKSNHDAKNIGARFRSARSLVPDLNRKSFCERYGINRYTMQSWENGLHVSKGKNVEKFIEALAREGVYCTSEWLIDGNGEPARPINNTNHRTFTNYEEAPALPPRAQDQLTNIINRLKDAYDDPLIVCQVEDDAMAPKFLAGDIVLGRPLQPENAHQKYCIIELNPERIITRKVLVTKDGYLLMALDERIPTITLHLASKLYEVVWHSLNQK